MYKPNKVEMTIMGVCSCENMDEAIEFFKKKHPLAFDNLEKNFFIKDGVITPKGKQLLTKNPKRLNDTNLGRLMNMCIYEAQQRNGVMRDTLSYLNDAALSSLLEYTLGAVYERVAENKSPIKTLITEDILEYFGGLADVITEPAPIIEPVIDEVVVKGEVFPVETVENESKKKKKKASV